MRIGLPALLTLALGGPLVFGCSDDPSGESSLKVGSVVAGADGSQGNAGVSPPTGSLTRRARFYVANTESSSISVIDHIDQKVIATIDLGGVSPHGHAPSSKGDRLYVSTDSGSGEVIAIDPFENSILWRTKVGSNLNEPHLTRDDRFLYAPDLLAGITVIVDVEKGEKVGAIDMVAPDTGWTLLALHNTYASYDGRYIYVTSILNQAIARIDVATRELDRIYRIDGQPRPAAVRKDDKKMYVQLSDLHGFIELDLETGEETARIVWPEPANSGSPLDIIFTTKCHGIGITPDGHELWAATNLEGAVYFYSLPELKQVGRLKIGNKPNWIAFSPDSKTGYVTNNEDGNVSVISVETHQLTNTITVGTGPKRIHLLEVPQGDASSAAPSFEEIYEGIVVATGCTLGMCHGEGSEAGGLDLRSPAIAYENLVGRMSRGPLCSALALPYVTPYRPEESLLVVKLESPPCGTRMPPGPGLSAGQTRSIVRWIEAGAPE
jgi:YVTN family beta-propeller protein